MDLIDAIANLNHSRVQVFIVSDGQSEDDWPGNPIETLSADRWQDFDVEIISKSSHSVLFNSPQARALYPNDRNVAIRVEFLFVMKRN